MRIHPKRRRTPALLTRFPIGTRVRFNSGPLAGTTATVIAHHVPARGFLVLKIDAEVTQLAARLAGSSEHLAGPDLTDSKGPAVYVTDRLSMLSVCQPPRQSRPGGQV